MMAAAFIRVDGLSRSAGGRQVFSGLTFSVQRGEALGITGPNGVGKTTLLRLIVGLIEPNAGSIAIDGESPRHALRRCRMSFFGGWPTLPPAVTAARWGRLAGVSVQRPWSHRTLGRLSPGLKQQAGLLAALGPHDLDLIVLDEPWDSLDAGASRCLSQELDRHCDAGATLVLTSHRLFELAAVCSRLSVLSKNSLHDTDSARPATHPNHALSTFDRSAVS